MAVQFCDCLGFENISHLRSKVLQQILDGKVKHGTQIDVDNIDTIEDQEVQNRVHFVLFVIPATMALDYVKNQYSQLRETVGRSGIPQMVLLTKVDTFRRVIEKSPEKIYVDAKAKECIEKISEEIDVRVVRPMVYNKSDVFSEAHGILCLDVMQDITAAVDEYLQNLPDDNAGCVIC